MRPTPIDRYFNMVRMRGACRVMWVRSPLCRKAIKVTGNAHIREKRIATLQVGF